MVDQASTNHQVTEAKSLSPAKLQHSDTEEADGSSPSRPMQVTDPSPGGPRSRFPLMATESFPGRGHPAFHLIAVDDGGERPVPGLGRDRRPLLVRDACDPR